MKRTFQLKKIRLKKRTEKITSYDRRGQLLFDRGEVARVLRSDLSMDEALEIPTHSDLEISLITAGEDDARPWPFFRFAFESEKAARRVLGSLSFIRKAEDTAETICIKDIRLGLYLHPDTHKWELMLWGAEKDALPFMETTLACHFGGGKKVSQGSLYRSALGGRIETEPEEVELFGLRRNENVHHFRTLESTFTALDLGEITHAIEFAETAEDYQPGSIQVSRTRLPLEGIYHNPGVRVVRQKRRLKSLLNLEKKTTPWTVRGSGQGTKMLNFKRLNRQ